MIGFVQRAAGKVADSTLRGALRRATDRLAGGRKAAMDPVELEERRQRVAEIRRRTLAGWSGYLDQAAAKVEEAGGKVFRAATAEEARRYVGEVLRHHGADLLVKSKSMVSEEIGLNQYLEAQGVEVVETDLGEFIIQLAGETPSHIIVPAIHKTREQVAEVFNRLDRRRGGQGRIGADTPSLTAFAREVLREKFLKARVGMTGCNFLVAESGTLVMVTNEGNGRLSASLPKVHVALMGIERILPTWEDLAEVLALLPVSATGQKITTYVNLVTGPKRPGDADGPEEFHLVMVDNGRSAIYQSQYRDILNCIRCGACLNACPVYRRVGGHAYGPAYSGPMGAVLTPLLNGLQAWGDLSWACSLCDACAQACPAKINLPRLLVEHRRAWASGPGRSWTERLGFKAWSWICSSPRRFGRALRWLRAIAGGSAGAIPIPGAGSWTGGWTGGRDLPPMPGRSFRELWEDGLADTPGAGLKGVSDHESTGRSRAAG